MFHSLGYLIISEGSTRFFPLPLFLCFHYMTENGDLNDVISLYWGWFTSFCWTNNSSFCETHKLFSDARGSFACILKKWRRRMISSIEIHPATILHSLSVDMLKSSLKPLWVEHLKSRLAIQQTQWMMSDVMCFDRNPLEKGQEKSQKKMYYLSSLLQIKTCLCTDMSLYTQL